MPGPEYKAETFAWPLWWGVAVELVHGNKAGPIRNAEMVEECFRHHVMGWATICVAFPRKGSIGTWDCVRRAADNGMPVYIAP